MEKDQHIKRIGYYLERTTRIVKLNYSQAFHQAGIDVTPEQWVMLDNLSKNNGQSQTELANKSFKDAPTTSRILDLLEKKGYIERQRFENDRRRYKIFLTNDGKKIIRKLQPLVNELRLQGWKDLTEEDYQSFLRIINQVFDNFDKS